MKDCTCKITPGTSAYGGNQIDSRGCEKHDTRDEIIDTLRARLAEVEGELSTSNAQLASVLQQHKADIRLMGRLLEDERCKVVTVEGEMDALREKAELLDWLQEQLVDVIYLDEGRVIDIGGKHQGHLLAALRAAKENV